MPPRTLNGAHTPTTSTIPATRGATRYRNHRKTTRFQNNLDCISAQSRDFRDQLPDFARLSCIGNGLLKNMARILGGVKSPFAPVAGGVGVLLCGGVPCSLAPLLCPVGLSSLQFLAVQLLAVFSRFKGLSRAGWCRASSRALKCLYGAFMGLYGLVILFACVPCPLARDKKPFLSLSFAVSVFAWSVLPCLSFLPSFIAL